MLRALALSLLAVIGLCVSGTGGSTWNQAVASGQSIPEADGIDGHVANYLDVGGIRTRFYEAGDGETMLLLHGGGGAHFNSANVWTRNITRLAEQFHVLAPDRLGAGRTAPDPEGDRSFERQAKFIYQFLNTLGVDEVHLVGHSSGGAVATLFALTYPDLVKSLVVLTTGPQMPRLGVRKMDIMAEACENLSGFEAWQCRLMALTWRPDDAYDDAFWESSQQMMEQEQRRQSDTPSQSGFPREGYEFWEAHWERVRQGGLLQMPILLLCGMQDPQDWHPPANSSEIKRCRYFFEVIGRNNGEAKLIVYNKAGHFPYRERPRQFNEDIIHFAEFWSGNHEEE